MDLLKDEASSHLFSLSVLGAVFLSIVVAKVLAAPSSGGLPLYGTQYGIYPKRVYRYMYNAQSMYIDAYNKLRNQVYRITTVDGEQQSELRPSWKLLLTSRQARKSWSRSNMWKNCAAGQRRRSTMPRRSRRYARPSA